MKKAICLGCRYLQFNEYLMKWECTRPRWRRYIENPGVLTTCPFFVRSKEGGVQIVLDLKRKRL